MASFYLIAGEASGDLHGSLLMQGLLQRDPSAKFRFWGGDKMASVAPGLVHHYKDGAVMGVVEVLAKAGKLRRNLSSCKADILAHRPDALILIDYPGFNLKIARFAHENGIKVYYYIAPKVWASREGRIARLKRYVDRMFVIFPFETDYFRKHGVDVVYEGNPLKDSILSALDESPSKERFFASCGLDPARPVVALLAGSRTHEISFLMPRFLELERMAAAGSSAAGAKGGAEALSGCQFVLAAAPSIDDSLYEGYLKGSSIKLVRDQTYTLLKYSDAAAVASGTASFETAIIGTPQVVCYGLNPLTFKIMRAFMKTKYVSLANIILDEMIFSELLQNDCSAANIASELESLLSNTSRRQKMLSDYARHNAILGEKGSAQRFASRMIEEL